MIEVVGNTLNWFERVDIGRGRTTAWRSCVLVRGFGGHGVSLRHRAEMLVGPSRGASGRGSNGDQIPPCRAVARRVSQARRNRRQPRVDGEPGAAVVPIDDQSARDSRNMCPTTGTGLAMLTVVSS
jgi:hypothetical protein